MHTEKRGRKRHYGIAAQWSLLWGPNTLADYGFVSGYCCSLSVERRMNPSDFSNGISETPADWALVLIPLALSAVSRRIGPHAWSKGAALQCNKEVPSAVPVSLFHSRWGDVAVLRGSERVNLAGLEKWKERALVQHKKKNGCALKKYRILLYIKTKGEIMHFHMKTEIWIRPETEEDWLIVDLVRWVSVTTIYYLGNVNKTMFQVKATL